MRERANHHPNQTECMRDAMAIFDKWLSEYREPSDDEKRVQRNEWEIFRDLCKSDANKHAYSKHPSKEELSRAQNDVKDGQRLLFDLLSVYRSADKKSSSIISFPLTSFVAIFGAGFCTTGLQHGYGKHTIINNMSYIEISGIEELLGSAKTKKLTLVFAASSIQIQYDRKDELASIVAIQQSGPTLQDLWGKAGSLSNNKRKRQDTAGAYQDDKDESTWICNSCTYIHTGKDKLQYLMCEVCNSQRNEAKMSI